MNSRRHFIRNVSATGVAMLIGTQARAQGAMVDEKDPTAVALGYVADATKANKTKYPQYKAGAKCGNCKLFQGTPTAAAGPCPLFAGKQVATAGWCSAHADK